MIEVKNAIIQSAVIDMSDRDLLTAWLHLDFGGSGQGFGGHALYLPKSYKNHGGPNYAGHFIYRCLQIAGVNDWARMPGKSIRARSEGGLIRAVGHIVKDDWFEVAAEFEKLREAAQ